MSERPPGAIGRRQPLWLLLALLIGLAGGASSGGAARAVLLAIAQPVGALWLDALTMTVVPLVFGLIVTGTAEASRGAAAGSVTLRALLWFAVLLTCACLAAALFTELLLQLFPAPATLADLPGVPAGPEVAGGGVAGSNVAGGDQAWYRGIIPSNPVRAAAEMAIVPIVVFSLFLGFATARLEGHAATALLAPIAALVKAMLVIVGWVLRVGPIGIGALAFGAGATLGGQAFGTLGHYVLVVSAVCAAIGLIGYLWAWLAGGIALPAFARAAIPAQMVALGTQSSLATLPVMLEAARTLRLRPEAAGVVLPMAVSLFRASSAAANVAVALYLAQLHGVATGAGPLIVAALVAVPVSLGAVGLPAQVSFFATIAPVCLAIGVPVQLLPLLLAVEAVPDLFRTVGNVTNDLAVATIAARPERPSPSDGGDGI